MTAIVGMGAFTPLGLTIVHSAFLLRTGMPGIGPSSLLDEKGEPVTFGLQGTLDPTLVGLERAEALLAPALAEASMPLREIGSQLRVAVLLALDEGLAVRDTWGASNPAADLVRAAQERAQQIFPTARVTPVARGAGGLAFALPDALAALNAGTIDALLVGGVHTDYDVASIRLLEAQGRLFTPENLDAVIPGECAAFVLLMRPDVARRAGAQSWARIVDVAGGFERATPDNDESAYEAKGLSVAVRAAARGLVEQKLAAGWMLTDLTFEMWRTYEWQSMVTRTRGIWTEPYVVDSPGQRIGRMGAAALPLQMALAAEGWRRAFGPHPRAIAFAGSDGGERGVVVLESTSG